MLADDSMQRTAIAEIVGSAKERTPLLLSWTRCAATKYQRLVSRLVKCNYSVAFGAPICNHMVAYEYRPHREEDPPACSSHAGVARSDRLQRVRTVVRREIRRTIYAQ